MDPQPDRRQASHPSLRRASGLRFHRGRADAEAPRAAQAIAGRGVGVRRILCARELKRLNMADIRVPTLGESVTEATVGKWFKQPGDAVAVDEPVVELETDKVTLEVPAPAAGVLSDIAAKTGDTVGVAALLGEIKEGAAAAPAKAAPAAAKPPEAPKPAPAPAAKAADMPLPPSVRKMAAESGIDAGKVAGSGMHGQVSKGDMMAAIERAAASPTPAAATPGAVQMAAPSPTDDAVPEERVHMTRLRQAIARRLKDAQNAAALLTTFNEVDM